MAVSAWETPGAGGDLLSFPVVESPQQTLTRVTDNDVQSFGGTASVPAEARTSEQTNTIVPDDVGTYSYPLGGFLGSAIAAGQNLYRDLFGGGGDQDSAGGRLGGAQEREVVPGSTQSSGLGEFLLLGAVGAVVFGAILKWS